MAVEVLEKEKQASYRDLRNEKNYIKNLLATAVSRFGDGIDAIAFSWLVYTLTGSTILVATLYAVNGIPNLIFGLVSGVVCKYFSEKNILVICDMGRGICVGLIAVLFITENLEVWHLYVITFMNSSFESFRSPAAGAIIPKILNKEKLERGIALDTSVSSGLELLGLAAAPIIISLIGIGGAIIIDCITFIVCANLILFIRIGKEAKEKATLELSKYFKDFKEGIIFIKNDNLLKNICIFAAIINALVVPFTALQAPYVDQVLNKGAEALSFIGAPSILGMIFGAIMAPKIREKLNSRNTFIIAGVGLGITYCFAAMMGIVKGEIVYLLLGLDIFIMGFSIVNINFQIRIVMFKKVSEEYLPRVIATLSAIALSIIPIASAVVGVLSEAFQIQNIFFILGVGTTTLFLAQIFNQVLKRLDE